MKREDLLDYASVLSKVKSQLQDRADKVVELEEASFNDCNEQASHVP